LLFPPGHPDPISALAVLAPPQAIEVAAWLRNVALAVSFAILVLLASGFRAKRRVLRL